MTLAELQVGEQGKVVAVNGQGALRRRLLDMGIIPNTIITIKKLAPMGDPMELSLRGYVLTLRKEDAAEIEINR